jgi:hypothetical protein
LTDAYAREVTDRGERRIGKTPRQIASKKDMEFVEHTLTV